MVLGVERLYEVDYLGNHNMMIMLTWALDAFKKLIICKKSPSPPGVIFIVDDVGTKCQHDIRHLNAFLHVDIANVTMILILMMLM